MRWWLEPPIEEGRPGERTANLKDSLAGESDYPILPDLLTRCRRCGHVLTDPKAIAAGVGWRCAARGGGDDE